MTTTLPGGGTSTQAPGWNQSYPYLTVADVANVSAKVPSTHGLAAFAHTINWSGQSVSNPINVTGPAIGLAPEDKWVLPYNNELMIVRS